MSENDTTCRVCAIRVHVCVTMLFCYRLPYGIMTVCHQNPGLPVVCVCREHNNADPDSTGKGSNER